MPTTRHVWVMDREAYAERRAIMEVEGADGLTAARQAADCAYKTKFGVAATAAANGDWKPAHELCAQIAQGFGADMAADVMRDIKETIEAELKWRR